MASIRRAAVSGTFYPSGQGELKSLLEQLFSSSKAKVLQLPHFSKIIGIVSPHAGYEYSGYVAAKGFSILKSYVPSPSRAIILGPNHRGVGSIISSTTKEYWATPLGNVKVDIDGIKQLLKFSNIIDLDDFSHAYEHSIEVQLPFLQYLYGTDFKIIPICMMEQDKHFALEVAKALLNIFDPERDIIVASSDFTHYESQNSAQKKDSTLISYIEKLDVDGFYDCLYNMNVTACGFGPIAVLMTISKNLNMTGSRLVSYMTSGDVIGDYDQVVGYASIVFGKW
ncbi:MAG: MEMO1 family protein [Nitrososphaeria archaeon]